MNYIHTVKRLSGLNSKIKKTHWFLNVYRCIYSKSGKFPCGLWIQQPRGNNIPYMQTFHWVPLGKLQPNIPHYWKSGLLTSLLNEVCSGCSQCTSSGEDVCVWYQHLLCLDRRCNFTSVFADLCFQQIGNPCNTPRSVSHVTNYPVSAVWNPDSLSVLLPQSQLTIHCISLSHESQNSHTFIQISECLSLCAAALKGPFQPDFPFSTWHIYFLWQSVGDKLNQTDQYWPWYEA